MNNSKYFGVELYLFEKEKGTQRSIALLFGSDLQVFGSQGCCRKSLGKVMGEKMACVKIRDLRSFQRGKEMVLCIGRRLHVADLATSSLEGSHERV